MKSWDIGFWPYEMLGIFILGFIFTHADSIWHWLERVIAG